MTKITQFLTDLLDTKFATDLYALFEQTIVIVGIFTTAGILLMLLFGPVVVLVISLT